MNTMTVQAAYVRETDTITPVYGKSLKVRATELINGGTRVKIAWEGDPSWHYFAATEPMRILSR